MTSTCFSHTANALKALENQLTCCKCNTFASSPVTLGGCEHIFCRGCCEEYLGQCCPICDIPGHVKDAEVDRQLFNIATLCSQLRKVLTDDTKQQDSQVHENGDMDIQSTPNQPIQGAVSHLTTVVSHDQHVSQPSTNKKLEMKGTPKTKVKQKKSGNFSPKVDVKNEEVKDKENDFSKRRRQSVPIDQTTMTQFYEYDEEDEHEGIVLPDENTTQEKGAARQKNKKVRQKSTAKDPKTMKTRLRHSVDMGELDSVNSIRRENVANDKRKQMKGKKTGANAEKENEDSNTDEAVNKRSKRANKTKLLDEESSTKDASRRVNIADESLNERTKPTWKSRPNKEEESIINDETGLESKRKSRPKVEPTKIRRRKSLPNPAVRDDSSSERINSKNSLDVQMTPVSQRSRSGIKVKASPSQQTTPITSTKKQKVLNKGESTPKGRQLNTSIPSVHSPALNKRNAKGETALQVAAIKNDVKKVSELLKDGANPNVRDNAGWTPLHEACNHGYVEVARLLLDNGAMINVPGHENDTALHDAINNNRVECVKLLVSRGASLTIRNMHGHTPQDLALSTVMKDALTTPVCNVSAVTDSEPMDVMDYQSPCILGTSLSRDEKITLQKGTSQLQVKLMDEVMPEVTHIITKVNNEGRCPRTVKLLLGILTGKWILNMEWLETSVQVGSLVCEEAFEVQGTSLFPDCPAPYKGRMNRKLQLPGLFDGCYFYFNGSFEFATPGKDDLINIIKAGGGKLLNREPKPGHLHDMTLTVPYHASGNMDDGGLRNCCVFLIHETRTKFGPIRTKHMCSVPASWIMDSAANFKLLPLDKI